MCLRNKISVEVIVFRRSLLFFLLPFADISCALWKPRRKQHRNVVRGLMARVDNQIFLYKREKQAQNILHALSESLPVHLNLSYQCKSKRHRSHLGLLRFLVLSPSETRFLHAVWKILLTDDWSSGCLKILLLQQNGYVQRRRVDCFLLSRNFFGVCDDSRIVFGYLEGV